MLSTEDLALLQAIRETGSLSRAAALSWQGACLTVSYAARQLEERFDALLFDRRRYRLQLTPAGELLVNEAARLMQDVSRLTQRVQQVANGWESRLWIVTDELLEFETLIPVIHEFDALGLRRTAAHHPGSAEGCLGSPAGRPRDLIIGATNEPPAIASSALDATGGNAVGVRRLAQASAGQGPRTDYPRHGGAAPGDCRGGFVPSQRRQYLRGLRWAIGAGGADHARKILAQCDGLGVGWLPRHRVTSLLDNGSLVEKQMADPREPNILYAGWRGDHDRAGAGLVAGKAQATAPVRPDWLQGSDRFA